MEKDQEYKMTSSAVISRILYEAKIAEIANDLSVKTTALCERARGINAPPQHHTAIELL